MDKAKWCEFGWNKRLDGVHIEFDMARSLGISRISRDSFRGHTSLALFPSHFTNAYSSDIQKLDDQKQDGPIIDAKAKLEFFTVIHRKMTRPI